MAVIKRRVGEKTFEQHRHAILVFTDGGSGRVTGALQEVGAEMLLCSRVTLKSSETSFPPSFPVLSGVYNMGGSPLPTVEKIKNLVYMNSSIDGETAVNPREEYLGKCMCRQSAKQLRPFT